MKRDVAALIGWKVTQPSANPEQPVVGEIGVSDWQVVSRIFASWNQLDAWLRQLHAIRAAV
jgi:hypothetical protein